MASFFVSLFLIYRVSSETLTFTNTSTPPNTIECIDPITSPCIINCNSTNICSNKEIHCHPTSIGSCTINFNAQNSGNDSIVYTHSASNVFINGNAINAAKYIHVHAYEYGGVKILIQSSFYRAFQYGTVYGPIGESSVLWMKCALESCSKMFITDDWTTTVRLEPIGDAPFVSSIVFNIFDAILHKLPQVNGINITRTDANYNNINMDYRGEVHLLDFVNSKDAFDGFYYNGWNHGNWIIYSTGFYSWLHSLIVATSDERVNQSVPYSFKMYGARSWTLRGFEVYFGKGAEVFIETRGYLGLYETNIHAKDANSLTIYCRESGYCERLNIECPSHGNCNYICSNTSTCKDNIRIDVPIPIPCNDIYLSNVYAGLHCGYDQVDNVCLYTPNKLKCAPQCGNETTGCVVNNELNVSSLLSSTEIYDAYDRIPIAFAPTINPTLNPTIYPTLNTLNPTLNPTSTPTNGPLNNENTPEDRNDTTLMVVVIASCVILVIIAVLWCCVLKYLKDIKAQSVNVITKQPIIIRPKKSSELSKGVVYDMRKLTYGNIGEGIPGALIGEADVSEDSNLEGSNDSANELYIKQKEVKTIGFTKKGSNDCVRIGLSKTKRSSRNHINIADGSSSDQSDEGNKGTAGITSDVCTDCGEHKLGQIWKQNDQFYCGDCFTGYYRE